MKKRGPVRVLMEGSRGASRERRREEANVGHFTGGTVGRQCETTSERTWRGAWRQPRHPWESPQAARGSKTATFTSARPEELGEPASRLTPQWPLGRELRRRGQGPG